MTPNAQRIAIATVLGLKDIAIRPIGDPESGVGYYDLCAGVLDRGGVGVPNYPQSLEACVRMEEILNHAQIGQYESHLHGIVHRFIKDAPLQDQFFWCEGHAFYLVAHASAAQRCEAFLKTLGLWDEHS